MAHPEHIKLRIAELQLEHRALDQMITRLSQAVAAPAPAVQTPVAEDGAAGTNAGVTGDGMPWPAESHDMQLRRMKKRKLRIKDSIVLLQMQLTPDVPA